MQVSQSSLNSERFGAGIDKKLPTKTLFENKGRELFANSVDSNPAYFSRLMDVQILTFSEN